MKIAHVAIKYSKKLISPQFIQKPHVKSIVEDFPRNPHVHLAHHTYLLILP